jgi:rhodanese-related sulfurtransferase
MKKAVFIAASLCLAPLWLVSQEIPQITAREAFELAKNPANRLVDVRSIAEYYLVGHPETAASVPLTFWDEKAQAFAGNEHFIDDIKARYRTQETLIFICRSGGRSLRAAQAAQAAGFAKVMSVKDGFEGEVDSQGRRTVGGWKNAGLPYTYDVKLELKYKYP